ncbi:FecR domain-containing protein [Pandoraea sp. NPDC087047]|uniref:FecR domain-containing protein n=1 Tax=Pandoraea sp. NPDC087047 TaxID=3364390 RepID=UPI00380E9DC4
MPPPCAASGAEPIDPAILDEAADWLVRLHGEAVTDAERQACARWRATSPAHALAWQRAEWLMNKLGSLPPSLAMPVLDRPRGTSRRAFVARVAAWLSLVPAGYGAWRVVDANQWTADHRTAAGEQRDIRLADGTQVTLGTASAFDVDFDTDERLIRLREGEIFVATAPDTAALHRPLRVGTAQGMLEALGTRFVVRQSSARTYVAVIQGAVRATPANGGANESRVVAAGQETWLDTRNVDPPSPADESATAWMRGLLLADRMPLAQFAKELERYRHGPVYCDPAVADLRVSGAFPIPDIDRTLVMLVSTYPVTVHRRLAGWWISLGARQDV